MPSSKKQLKIDTVLLHEVDFLEGDIHSNGLCDISDIGFKAHVIHSSAWAHYIQGSLLVWLLMEEKKKRNSDVLF